MWQASAQQRATYHKAGHAVACLTYAVPIISVTVAHGRPHLHRGVVRGDMALEIVGTVCFAGPAAEELFCGPPQRGDDGSGRDYAMAYELLQQHVGPLRLRLEFERLRDSARALVRTNWARRAIPKLADALLRNGTLDAGQVNDMLLLD